MCAFGSVSGKKESKRSLSSAPDSFRIGEDSLEQFWKSPGIWTERGGGRGWEVGTDRPGRSPLDSDSLAWVGFPSCAGPHPEFYREVHSHRACTHQSLNHNEYKHIGLMYLLAHAEK